MGLQLLSETPLEALVFRHSATAGGSLWTWVAVLAAALGLWCIRTAAAAPRPQPSPGLSNRAAPAQGESVRDLPKPPLTEAHQQQQPPRQVERSESPAVDGGDVICTPKGAVFELRGCHVEEENDDGGIEEGEVPEEQGEYTWSGESGVVTSGRVKWLWTGDLGWYRYQDMAALNGRVVRLWEYENRLASPLLRRRRPQAAW